MEMCDHPHAPGLFVYGKDTSVLIQREKEVVTTQNVCLMLSNLVIQGDSGGVTATYGAHF
jgi:hypothetical protein